MNVNGCTLTAARQSQSLQRGTHAARFSRRTRAQVQPVTHIRERLEVLITHLNEERIGIFFPKQHWKKEYT